MKTMKYYDGIHQHECVELSIFTNGSFVTREIIAEVNLERGALVYIRTRDNKFWGFGRTVLNTCFNGEPKSVVVVVERHAALNEGYIERLQRSMAKQMLESLEAFSNKQKESYSKAADMCSSFKQQAGGLL